MTSTTQLRGALACVAFFAFGACATARPQSPDPQSPERGVVPVGPPAPNRAPTAALDPAPTLAPTAALDPAPAPEPVVTPTALPAPSSTPDQAFEQMRSACTRGPMPECALAITNADSFQQPPEARQQILIEQARLQAWTKVDSNAIGVLLPLSGDYAAFGIAAKEAIDLALREANSTLRVVVRDTEGNADKARMLATELVLKDRVAALLGPIGRKESSAVADIARFMDIPLVPLTSDITPSSLPAPSGPPSPTAIDDGLRALLDEAAGPMVGPIVAPLPADPVLRVRTSPNELATAIARHARTELGITNVALLVPTSAIGSEAALAFREEFVRLGGNIVREVAFDPAAKDFAEPLKDLLVYHGLSPKERKPNRIKPDFDGLFIPADALVVRRVVPFLAYWGIHPRTAPDDKSRVQLLGTSAWNHPAVVDKGEHLTNNAVFADVFAPDDPDAQDFGRTFFLHLQRRPTSFHAEVWDATRLVIDTLARLPVSAPPIAGAPPIASPTRSDIRDTFATPRMLVGATGPLEVLPGGRLQPRAHLMTIDGDEIRARLSEDEERVRRTTPTLTETPP